ncbi:MAG: tetratricopeptide repeat protein [Gallionella sp.]|nr:tetratricopeptide repeat protein [Gallionella sp.]
MNSTKYLIVASLLLTACAQVPQQAEPVPSASAANAAPVSDPSGNDEQPDSPDQSATVQPSEADLPKQELTGALLYEYLVSEIASQRGYKTLAANGSEDLAIKTRDPRLAKRAAQLAFESGDMEKSVAAFKFWQEIEPGASIPSRMLASIWLRGGDLEQSKAEFAKVLKDDAANANETFLQIEQILEAYPDKPAALAMMRELAAPYPRMAEAHWSVARLARAAGDVSLALSEAKQARSLRPDWDLAVALEAELLQKSAPQQSLQVLRDYLAKHPSAYEIRLQYARVLVEQQQYPAARAEFQRVADHNPDNPDLVFAIALLSLQMNDLQGAETELKQALGKGKKDQDTVQYYLGQLSEAKQQDDEAIAHYREVKEGEHVFASTMRIAYLLSKHDKLDEARQILHQLQPANNLQRSQMVLVEAQLLRDAQKYDEAYQVLQQGLEQLPNHPVLLYETAMMADKIGKYDVTEQYLRKLIQMNPQDANAYNALGYSLLERNVRIPEAVGLVEQALQLAPDDASIIDSVGWGYYRSGKLDDSVKMLRRAFAANPDPEIASHLGEVLWMRGDKAEAQQILQTSLKAHPDNEPLQAVIKKLIP